MIYRTATDWNQAASKRLMLFGMSGLGKTHVSNLLRASGGWFHYSVDYRIGTRYMGEHIADNFKREAMKVPLLRELLMSDSVYIASNITFNNLAPLSTYLGKPGNSESGGLPFAEYMRRQEQHRQAEVSAMMDTAHFIERAKAIYDYDNFVCDSSGSICEVVDPWDPTDSLLTALSETVLMVWIEGTEAHTEELVRRFDRAPKPMCYQIEFLQRAWEEYLCVSDTSEDEVDPNAFVRWTYARALAHRQPRYEAIARNWGIKISAKDISKVTTASEMIELVASALAER